jgi:hypothetical protein
LPWPVHSERFVYSETPAVLKTWTVPIGMRAVVKSVALVNNQTTTAAGIFVAAHGITLYYKLFQEFGQAVQLSMHQVVYGGETVSCQVGASSQWVMVSGFLFEDPSEANKPPGTFKEHAWKFPEALPS